MKENRRKFLSKTVKGAGVITLTPMILSACGKSTKEDGVSSSDSLSTAAVTTPAELFFKISLAEWSLHKTIRAKELTNLQFPAKAKELGINAVEYVSTLFDKDAADQAYLAELKQVTSDLGVTNVLIMIDNEGNLGAGDDAERNKAVENHHRWVDAAKFLGCHSIRVNARGEGTAEEVAAAAVDGLGKLSEYGQQNGIGIIVENHGGYSSNGKWLADVMKQVNNEYCGTLPDFGNFRIDENEEYDRYQGIDELMPFAKGVSAKTNIFNADGNEAVMDYERIMKIVKGHGFTGYVGIEYEGNELSEIDGIIATKKLLEKVGAKLS
ncbi:MAG: sugar phosphate isomerase/epimerase [Cyclobacteriaceae bacterium]|nr:sugar phosphate isomerase/epimerase [Cyclobacteriaceae bacterium]